MSTSYRPEPGTTLWISAYYHTPFLVNVVGYSMDKRFACPENPEGLEVIQWVAIPSGKKDTTLVKELHCYPEVPLNARYLYIVRLDDYDGSSVDKFFFDVDSAYNRKLALESGKEIPRIPSVYDSPAIEVHVELLSEHAR